MIRLRDISIRAKLVIMLVFTSVLVLIIVFAVFIVTDIRAYKQRRVKSLVSLAQVIGTNCVSTLQFQDNEAARDILSELYNVAPDIRHAGITDKKGNLFASYARQGIDSFRVLTAVKERDFTFTDKELLVGHDIVDHNEVIGRVYLEADLAELKEIKQSKYELATILLFVAIGFSFMIAIVIQQYISRRLLYLVNTMKDVSKTGNYNKPIVDEGRDEISTLTRVFNDLMKQVMENQRKKDEFIGIASHELKTPLTSVKGYVELLNGIEDKQPNKQFVQKALENVNKLEKLIKDLLDVSKIQSGQLELNMREFSIDILLDETIAGFQMIATTHEIIREDGVGDAMISADRQRIEQVLVNLLSNAIKYSPGEKKVLVYSQKTNTELIVKVRDFGIGVPKEEQSNIFERFYRTKDTSIHISGFGLGLYIARDIIKRHSGRIWVETQEKGSAFYFSLPLKNVSDTEHNGTFI